jgi:2-desacetyl-2-hydroxyethyl bacteriochlorophyllide A dehydrogenase
MRAYVMFGARDGRVVEMEAFPPGAGDVVLRTKATAICTTERRIFEGSLKIPYPVIGGHEVSAVVENVAGPETGFAPGDHVVLDGVNRCGRCHFCRRGQSNLCPLVYSTRREPYQIVGGGFAERITVPASRLFRVKGTVSHAEAALTEPLSCCIHSVTRSAAQPGDVAAIIGAGTMGALHVLVLKLMGATVFVSDPDEGRRRLAQQLGAHVTIDPNTEDPATVIKERTGGRLADVVFIAASVKAAGQQALTMIERAGRVMFFAATHPPERLDVDWNLLHHKEVSLVGSVGKMADDFRKAAALIGNGAVNVRPLISRTIALGELQDELSQRPSGGVQRVVVSLEDC